MIRDCRLFHDCGATLALELIVQSALSSAFHDIVHASTLNSSSTTQLKIISSQISPTSQEGLYLAMIMTMAEALVAWETLNTVDPIYALRSFFALASCTVRADPGAFIYAIDK